VTKFKAYICRISTDQWTNERFV